MTILELRSKDAGRVMLRDLGRVDQFTNPPVTAMTMFPIAQLIVGEEVGSIDEGIGRVMLMEKSCEDCIRTVYTLLPNPVTCSSGSAVNGLRWDMERSG
jgi:hypothetical protein